MRRSPKQAPSSDREEREREERLQKVIGMLSAEPDRKFAVMTQFDGEEGDLIVTVAVRSTGAACELVMSRETYDAFDLINLIDKHGGTVGAAPDQKQEKK